MCEIQRVIGFQKNIKGGLLFSKQSTLFYLAGQTGVFHDLNNNTQEFLLITEKKEFTAMTLGGKHLLALASKGCTPKLIIYNLKSTENFILPNPEDSKKLAEYIHVCFTEDSEYLAAQGGGPRWPFIMWHIKKRCISGVFVPSRLENTAKVLTFSFFPKDKASIVAIGKCFFRIYQCKSENRFKEEVLHRLERSRKTFHCLTWLPKTEKFVIGTSDGKILIFNKKQLLQEVSIEKKLEDIPRIFSEINNPEDKNVTCILSSKEGIICSYGGSSVLCLRWKIDRKDLNIVTSIQAPKRKQFTIDRLKIEQLALNSSEDILAAATDHGQILTSHFNFSELLGIIGYEREFDVIVDQQHKTPVVCADTAISTPVHATCSESDVILWDYQKKEFLLWKSFDDNICSVSIHPLGIYLLIGFRESWKMYIILYDKLEEVLKIQSNGNIKVKFSDGGHLMAHTNAASIEIYSCQSCEKCAELTENDALGLENDEVTCMLWKNNDSRMLSLNKAGNVYEWDVGEQTKLRSYSSNGVFSTLAHYDDNIYVGTTDFKIWIFNNDQKIAEIETQEKVTSFLITRDMLLVGAENGKINGYRHPFGSDTFFETNFHQRSIINMTLKLNGKLLLATGEDGAITMWKMDCDLGTTVEMTNEVLIEQELYNSLIDTKTQLERELKEKKRISEKKKTELSLLQEAEKTALMKHYEDIQNQLKQTILALTEEKYNRQLDMENTLLENMTILSKEREKNYTDFQSKLAAEQETLKNLEEERVTKMEEYERQLLKMNEETENSCRKLKKIKEENENRLKELELMLQELCYQNEYSHSLNAEFGKKKQMYDELKRIANHIQNRIKQTTEEIQRQESGLEDKVSMIQVLEQDSKEIDHFNSEANLKFEECKEKLQLKQEELSKLQAEYEKLKSDQNHLTRKLKLEQREQRGMNEKLKATEKSIADSTQKLLKSQLLLERYRKEFIETTTNIENPISLGRALLQLYDKRVLRKCVKEEEVFVGDPFMKFCRQSEHYESLINTALNRKGEIQASFRNTYVNLAKENSDWTAFAEALRSDIRQKQERIQILETVVKLPARDFIKDLPDTQKRFSKAYEDLKSIEKLEEDEIEKRLALIETQTNELQRLHGLIVVEKQGQIVKMGH